MPYQFEWDADKAAANLRKHGVPFDEAVRAFSDPLSLLQDSPRNASATTMKKTKVRRQVREVDRDTMRPEYDFSKGVRGVTAARYREGTNIIVLDPSLMDVFPDSEAVNEALRALASVLRRRKRA